MAADVEEETFVLGRAGNAAHVLRIGFQDGDRNLLLRQEITGGQSGGAGSDDGDGRLRHGNLLPVECVVFTEGVGWQFRMAWQSYKYQAPSVAT